MRPVIPFAARLPITEKQAWFDALRNALPDCDVLFLEDLTEAQCAVVEVAIAFNPDPTYLNALPNLKWIQSLWAGVEQLLADTQDTNVTIVRMIDPQLSETMAEAVLAWTLYLHRDMPRYRAQQNARLWQQHPLLHPSQQTVGILGLGNLGTSAIKTLAHNGFKVCGWGRSPTSIAGVETYYGADGLAAVLQQSTILICLLPLTRQTRGLLNHKALTLLPKGASLINFARGPIVDTDALLDHLNRGNLSHAVLDVFDEEPLPQDSPLWSHSNITVLPHISAPTNKHTASKVVADNITQFLMTGEIPPSVDRALGY